MRIHVTGADGFIGRHVVEEVRRRGHEIVLMENAQVMIHLAWRGLPNYESPKHFENIPAQIQILQEARRCGIQTITIPGTCLEAVKNPPPYAQAKRLLCLWAQEFLPVRLQWVRLFYVYGEGQRESTLLSKLHAAAARGDKRFSVVDASRDFVTVSSVASYLVRITTSPLQGVVDCCSGIATPVVDFCKSFYPNMNYTLDYPPRGYEPKIIVGNPTTII